MLTKHALRASVSFSLGWHDEWNISHLINERQRGAVEFGIAGQLPILLDGHGTSPGNFEGPIASGNAGHCVNTINAKHGTGGHCTTCRSSDHPPDVARLIALPRTRGRDGP